jgi:hypothetical protein
LQQVFTDFELDLQSSLPASWTGLLQQSSAAADSSSSPGTALSTYSNKLRSRLQRLLSSCNAGSNGNLMSGSGNGCFAVDGLVKFGSSNSSWQQQQQILLQLPSVWARKLEAVVEVLQLAGEEEVNDRQQSMHDN